MFRSFVTIFFDVPEKDVYEKKKQKERKKMKKYHKKSSNL